MKSLYRSGRYLTRCVAAVLIVQMQTESNSTDDASIPTQALPDTKRQPGVEQKYADGGFKSQPWM